MTEFTNVTDFNTIVVPSACTRSHARVVCFARSRQEYDNLRTQLVDKGAELIESSLHEYKSSGVLWFAYTDNDQAVDFQVMWGAHYQAMVEQDEAYHGDTGEGA